MSRNRAMGFVGLLVVVGAFASASPREALAANTTPFTWSKYTAKDGKEYNSPRWNDVGGGNRTLKDAQGTLSYPQNPAVTKVVFKVYQHVPAGGWNAIPVISYQVTPNPTYVGFPINGWTLVGKDNNIPLKQFAEGEELKIVWEITTRDNNNVEVVSTVDLIITVQYHAD